MDTFLPPIEQPAGLMMKLVFAMTRRQFGKVVTPLKVFTARLPLRFGQFYAKVSQGRVQKSGRARSSQRKETMMTEQAISGIDPNTVRKVVPAT